MFQNFRLYHCRDINVARVAKIAKFQTSSFSGYQGSEGYKGCKGWRFSDFIIFRIIGLRGLQTWLDIKVGTRVANAAKFQTLAFSGYQDCEGCKGCKISDFIIFRIPGLQRLQSSSLYHFQDIKVARVPKFQTLSFSGYQGC